MCDSNNPLLISTKRQLFAFFRQQHCYEDSALAVSCAECNSSSLDRCLLCSRVTFLDWQSFFHFFNIRRKNHQLYSVMYLICFSLDFLQPHTARKLNCMSISKLFFLDLEFAHAHKSTAHYASMLISDISFCNICFCVGLFNIQFLHRKPFSLNFEEWGSF